MKENLVKGRAQNPAKWSYRSRGSLLDFSHDPRISSLPFSKTATTPSLFVYLSFLFPFYSLPSPAFPLMPPPCLLVIISIVSRSY